MARPNRTILGAVLVPLFLSAFDQTVVSTVMPRIVASLSGLEWYAWVFTAYMLATTACAPIAGRLGDRYGRRPALLIGVLAFALASCAAALAPTMPALVLARLLQGFGSAAISANSLALVGDLYPPAERGRIGGLFSGVYALASVVGPVIGGALADRFGWRAIFWLNAPLCLAAVWVLRRRLPVIARVPSSGPVDYAGAFLLIGTVVSMMLAMSSRHPVVPASARLPLLALALVLAVVFLLIERRAADPIVPLALFRSPVFAVCMVVLFISGAGIYSCGLLLPFFMQEVKHATASFSGLVLMPMSLLLVVGSIIGGQIITRTGTYKLLTVVGLGATTAGSFALSCVDQSTTPREVVVWVSLIGLGLGLALPTLGLAMQNAVAHEYLGIATALSQFARTLGGAIGVTWFGEVLLRELHNGPAAAVGAAFFAATISLVIAFVLSLALRQIPLRRSNAEQPAAS